MTMAIKLKKDKNNHNSIKTIIRMTIFQVFWAHLFKKFPGSGNLSYFCDSFSK